MKTDPRHVLDLNIRAATHRAGNLDVILTWVQTTGRPCIVLVPARIMPTNDRVVPCIITLEEAWLWDETVGDPAECARISHDFAAALGLDPLNYRDVINVTTAIREYLGDLLTMPSLTLVAERDVVADAIVTDLDTGETREQEIIDNV